MLLANRYAAGERQSMLSMALPPYTGHMQSNARIENFKHRLE
jgi:hypothetical protein